MVWKDLSYRLKGGIIGGLPLIIVAILYGFAGFFSNNRSCGFIMGSSCSPLEFFFQVFLIGLIASIPFWLIGTFIGWIIGKIKNK